MTQASSGINTLNGINRSTVQLLVLLAQEAVSSRYDPAGGHQGASAEVHLAHIDGRHPGMRAWQSRAPAQDATPGHGQPLLVPFPADWLFACTAPEGHLHHRWGSKGIYSSR